ncbi:Methyltransferase type 11 [Ferroglobus placidus DSM 10642]|uniref:Methyltransferase type 11 n=1 Tax=Ferroglobus placidus (strain DSM 10642 / AEDII12DO) TaxID=589924 RepID=D3RXD2_FERPA|nr:methyltransferase domain-containing protein [Ferroglobus placidus]ADC65145.1 Methyltransferase type 11 [Ferroglobus placidus DSM 10642]
MLKSFESDAKRYERGANLFSFLLYRRAINDLKRLGVGGKYLDAGCGVGILAVKISKLLGVEVLGVDISKDMIELARRRAEKEGAMVKSGGYLYVLDVRSGRFIKHGLPFEKFEKMLRHLDGAESVEIKKKFPFLSIGLAKKKS